MIWNWAIAQQRNSIYIGRGYELRTFKRQVHLVSWFEPSRDLLLFYKYWKQCNVNINIPYDQVILLLVMYWKEMSTWVYEKYNQNICSSIVFNRNNWKQPCCFLDIRAKLLIFWQIYFNCPMLLFLLKNW